MAYLRGLIRLFGWFLPYKSRRWVMLSLIILTLGSLAWRDAQAQSPPYGYSCSYNAGAEAAQACPITYLTKAAAESACLATYNYFLGQGWHHYAAYQWSCGISGFPQTPNSTCYYMSLMNSTNAIGTEGYFCGATDGQAPPNEAECLARNLPQPGDTDGRGAADRWFVEGTAPTSYCNGLCTLNVWLTSWPAQPGVNPQTGAPVMWTKHHQEYSGATCTGGVNPADGPVENSPGQDLSSQPPQDPPEWDCNPQAGTCTNPENGEPNYCTFTGNPPVKDVCTPSFADSDNDGIPNNSDSAPNDATNGADTTGDEGDNTSSGGGSCISPPVSTGDGIQTQIAYQTWATRCAVEALKTQSATVSGTALTSTQAAQLAATAASTAATATNSANTATNTALTAGNTAAAAVGALATADGIKGMTDAQRYATEGEFGAAAGADVGTAASLGHGTETEYGAAGLDSAGLGASNVCPVIPSVEVLGQALEFDTTIFCEWMQLAGLLVVAFASLGCLRIIAGTT